MLKSYTLLALRNLWKNKVSSFVNLAGLTAGLTCCLLIGLYLQYELRFDRFQPKGDRIARVVMAYKFDGSPQVEKVPVTSTKVAPVFRRTFPEVEAAVRMTANDLVVLRRGNDLVSEPHFLYTDSTFFQVFEADFVAGNPAKALNGPYKVVLTESSARKYFGTMNPVGKLLQTGKDTIQYEVTGVVRDYPPTSQIRFDFLASFSTLHANQEESYFNANFITYLLLKDKDAFGPLEAKINPFMKKEMAGSGASISYSLEPFGDIHLHSPYDAFVPNTHIDYLYILAGVALLILAIVCFTYINLSTARSVERAREVGVRKVIGAGNNQLFWQFIGESGVICLVAMLLSLDLVTLLLPWFNNLADKSLSARDLLSAPFLLFSLGITLVVSLLAGSYPALVLTGFQPVKVLKGTFRHTGSGRRVQQSLIVFQFAITLFLIVATLVIRSQLQLIRSKNLGYDREHVVEILVDNRALTNLNTIKQELKTNPNVLHVSRCVATPVDIYSGYNMRTATMPENEQIPVIGNAVDEEYLPTSGIPLVAGSNFSEQDIRDVDFPEWGDRKYHFILNESAARQLGWTPEEAVGKRMFLDNLRPGIVRGVVRDFHFQSLHEPIRSLVLSPEVRGRRLLVRLSGHQLPETLAFLQRKWKQVVPTMPFEYKFLDDKYNGIYRAELQLGDVMSVFTTLSLVLACLGLFGLTSYIVQQRIKEIGIRKVLGASVSGIVVLISGGFVRLVLIALAIAFPLAWFAADHWLSGFAYHVRIAWWIFAAAGAGTLGVTLLTVGFQAVKAAWMNPVKSLKSE